MGLPGFGEDANPALNSAPWSSWSGPVCPPIRPPECSRRRCMASLVCWHEIVAKPSSELVNASSCCSKLHKNARQRNIPMQSPSKYQENEFARFVPTPSKLPSQPSANCRSLVSGRPRQGRHRFHPTLRQEGQSRLWESCPPPIQTDEIENLQKVPNPGLRTRHYAQHDDLAHGALRRAAFARHDFDPFVGQR